MFFKIYYEYIIYFEYIEKIFMFWCFDAYKYNLYYVGDHIDLYIVK